MNFRRRLKVGFNSKAIYTSYSWNIITIKIYKPIVVYGFQAISVSVWFFICQAKQQITVSGDR